jgi:hypothetical protein
MIPGIEIASQQVVIAYGRLGGRVHDMTVKVMTAFGLDVSAGAKRLANVKTGKLRRSINFPALQESPGVITGVVGPNVVYARRVHDGFQGTENVKSFFRMQTKAWGRDIAPRQVQVRAFTRNVNQPGNPFLLSAFEAVRPLSESLSDGMSKLGLA